MKLNDANWVKAPFSPGLMLVIAAPTFINLIRRRGQQNSNVEQILAMTGLGLNALLDKTI
ncbi:MAG: hypothetical protein DMG85_01855 [Acidobacteria bacterium]|nr:MAG: hypothetical protein DMG85_01855 [Acidobacteriota bacterium]